MTDHARGPQAELLEQLLAEKLAPAEERTAIDHCLRGNPSLATPLLYSVVAQKHRLRALLEETNKVLQEPPWHPGVFLSFSSSGGRALVACGNRRISVAVAPGVDPLVLRRGQAVFLNGTQSVLTATSDEAHPGAIGEFSRLHGAWQAVIRSHGDEEIVVDLAASVLDNGGLQRGDLVLYDRDCLLAYERLERREGSRLLENLPLDVRIEDIGGLDAVFEELVAEFTLHMFHPDLVRRYAMKPVKGFLLCGPPGTGKTSLVQALGEHLTRTIGVDVKAFRVPPGVHRSMWFGASEQRVRDLFREAKQAAERSDRYVLLFFDDMDHLGSRDHRVAGEVDARLVPCFLQEIDEIRTPRLLLVGATNREDLLDEGLIRPGRFGKPFRIGRPTRHQAREIFRRHLTADLPVLSNGHGSQAAVHALIEDLLSALYAPNGELATLATLTFRDGSRQPLTASQLMSGAVIAAAVERSKRRGCFRALKGGPDDISAADLRDAMARELSSIAERLRPGTALQQLLDLPPDKDVVKVERRQTNDHSRSSLTLNAFSG